MVVQAAGQLGLLEMSSNVLVRHLLETSLKEIDFLQRINVSEWVQELG